MRDSGELTMGEIAEHYGVSRNTQPQRCQHLPGGGLMTACERCREDAGRDAMLPGGSVADHYQRGVREAVWLLTAAS
jgi:hypothetical protein